MGLVSRFSLIICLGAVVMADMTSAFVGPSSLSSPSSSSSFASKKVGICKHSELAMMDVSLFSETANAVSAAATATTTTTIIESSGLLLAETEPWVQPLAFVLDPFLNFLSFAMLCRVVASWYPETNLNELPWNIIAWPTEPLLRVVKGSIPPAFGVDITPVFWLAIFTFLHEILLGQQGLLIMKIKYGI